MPGKADDLASSELASSQRTSSQHVSLSHGSSSNESSAPGEDTRGAKADEDAHGLAPTAARDWLTLQRAMAWTPELVGEPLRAGLSPRAILDAVSRPPSSSLPGAISDREIAVMDRLRIRVLPLTHPDYPAALAEIEDAPPVLLVRGRVAALSRPSIAIVGARAATQAARSTARRLARELASVGFSVVSGLARGIDAAAHEGALEGMAATVGVLACGLDSIYPPEHRSLATRMLEQGAVVSEMPLAVPPRRAHFPLRNRIISGLCRAVIVVEARRRSGSLITVRHALAQGREVFVVPGSIDGPFAEGTNQLLRDGARAIRSAADVVEDLGCALPVGTRADGSSEDTKPGQLPAMTSEARILAALEAGAASRDDLLVHVDLQPGELARALLELTLAGRIVEERDGRIHATWV